MNTKMQYVYIHKETYIHNKYIFICGCVGGSVSEGRIMEGSGRNN